MSSTKNIQSSSASRTGKKDWGQPERLSLDEFSSEKGRGKFVTVVTDLDKSSVLELIDSRKSDEAAIPSKKREKHTH